MNPPRHGHGTGRRRGLRRLVLAGSALVVLAIGTTTSAFTDTTVAGLGTTGAIGGTYDIALRDGGGAVHQGNPTAYALDTTGVARVKVGPVADSAEITARVVTTSAATGPVVLRLYNAFSGTRPADPGYAGPGVDPYDVALFTVRVDGVQVASAVTAASLNATGIAIPGWATGTAKVVTVSPTLPRGLGNPYYFTRPVVLGLQFDGSTA